MKEQAIRRINGIGHAGQIIANICKVLLIIAIVCLLIAACLVLSVPKGAVTINTSAAAEVTVDPAAFDTKLSTGRLQSFGNWSFDVDGVALTQAEEDGDALRYSGEASSQTVDIHSLYWRFLLGCLGLAVMTVSMFFIASLCKSLRYCETPFKQEIIIKIRRVAYSLIPWALLGNMEEVLDIFNIGGSIDVGISLEMVLLVLVVLALSFVFQYGAALQQESDETL